MRQEQVRDEFGRRSGLRERLRHHLDAGQTGSESSQLDQNEHSEHGDMQRIDTAEAADDETAKSFWTFNVPAIGVGDDEATENEEEIDKQIRVGDQR